MTTGGNAADTYNGGPSPQGSYIENTIIIQYDPLLQEVWDQARKMRCTWYVCYIDYLNVSLVWQLMLNKIIEKVEWKADHNILNQVFYKS